MCSVLCKEFWPFYWQYLGQELMAGFNWLEKQGKLVFMTKFPVSLLGKSSTNIDFFRYLDAVSCREIEIGIGHGAWSIE